MEVVFGEQLPVQVVQPGLFPSVHHCPEQGYAFRLGKPGGDEVVVEHHHELQCAFHHEAVGADGREDVVHLRERLYHPVAFQRARQVEEHDFRLVSFL